MAIIVVGISGASGSAVAVEALRLLKQSGAETHLVVSKWGGITLEHECGMKLRELYPLVEAVHSNLDLAAPIASGSFRCDATLIAPCSTRTLGSLATGSGDTLISRAADVAIKERRRLVLGLREAPLSSIHLRNALRVSDAGAVVYPLVPTFYAQPVSVQAVVRDMAARLIELCGIETDALPRWGETVDLSRKHEPRDEG
jgi:4-hydroxy-3-polyprenylbenzoate decarboxylase